MNLKKYLDPRFWYLLYPKIWEARTKEAQGWHRLDTRCKTCEIIRQKSKLAETTAVITFRENNNLKTIKLPVCEECNPDKKVNENAEWTRARIEAAFPDINILSFSSEILKP